MIKMQRLGVVLQPQETETRTVAKFNAGMVLDGDIVHMVYRFGVVHPCPPPHRSPYLVNDTRYAQLTPDGKLIRDTGRALLEPDNPFDSSGCEDARIIPFEGWFYLTYCGWDINTAPIGKSMCHPSLARTRDFVNVEKLGSITHYTWDKDLYIFPERIHGKIAFVHRISPNIQIDYFDSFEALLDPAFWSRYDEKSARAATVMEAAFPWEQGKVGGSVPPIRTEKGWLFLYHGVENFPGKKPPFCYRAGAALMDLENPSRIIARLPYPILEPEEDYELYGDVDNVVFPVGGYLHNGYLMISYGGGDRCVALARTPLDALLKEFEKYPC